MAEVEHFDRLWRALGRLGFHRSRAQTAREFSEAVARSGPKELAPLRTINEAFYRARFGHRPLRQDELDELDAFVARLERLRPH